MILSIINVSASAEKRTEVVQTLVAVAPMIRAAKGCVRCKLCQEFDHDTAYTLIEEWQSREAFEEHLRSQIFCVLLGLTPLLVGSVGVSICTIASKEGIEAVKNIRGQ